MRACYAMAAAWPFGRALPESVVALNGLVSKINKMGKFQ